MNALDLECVLSCSDFATFEMRLWPLGILFRFAGAFILDIFVKFSLEFCEVLSLLTKQNQIGRASRFYFRQYVPFALRQRLK